MRKCPNITVQDNKAQKYLKQKWQEDVNSYFTQIKGRDERN